MLFKYPIKYVNPLFRPPAEANSVILQVTIGCSWNKCAFCEMYASKKFKIRNEGEILNDIDIASEYFPENRKFFLADGNAMVLSTKKLLLITNYINKKFKQVQRISSYALPSDILSKSPEELKELRQAGLKLLYIGIESGDDDILKMVNKSENQKSTIEGIQKSHNAGIETSVMIISGLGGKKYSMQHALNSAKVINETSPKFLSMLTLSLPFGLQHFMNKYKGGYQIQSDIEILDELKIFINELKLENTIFRTDHISNILILKGILNRDKKKMINEINNYKDKIVSKL